MTPEQRRSVDNGIWLCPFHARMVDLDAREFPVERLHEWQAQARRDSYHRILYDGEHAGGSAPCIGDDELRTRIKKAATKDLESYRRSPAWPPNAISRTFEVEGLGERISTAGLARIITHWDDLIVIAEPGMGKTTMIFELADAVLENGDALPIVIPLGDWSVRSESLIDAILKRSSFREISKSEFHAVAESPGVLLLLDGWNELDSSSRGRATAELRELGRDLPGLSLLIATRKQALDVPISGARVDLQPLSHAEQVALAQGSCGLEGEQFLEEAWRISGMHDLVSIPLYLSVLLRLPSGSTSVTTKEGVLRGFVAVHEEDDHKAQVLRELAHGLHQHYLEALAVSATRAATTAISDADGRKSMIETGKALVEQGQIVQMPEPRLMLDGLVHHHALICEDGAQGYRFQHQQIQEWYASLFVERLMCASIGSARARDTLRMEVLDQRAWEEPILFACERLARGDDAKRRACAAAIEAAFDVDPILSAEMIYRSTDDVWKQVKPIIMDIVERWHVPGVVDTAVRFMITSGRVEFFDFVWPLITNEDQQIRLAAIRAGTRFRSSILGSEASGRIAALAQELRKSVLHGIALNGAMDGLDLVVAVAKSEPSAEIRASAVEALTFRGADRHVADVLSDADDAVFDELVRMGLADHIRGETVQGRLSAAQERKDSDGLSPYELLSRLRRGLPRRDEESDVATAVAEVEIEDSTRHVEELFHQLQEHFPNAVAEGMLRRVRDGSKLPFGAVKLMAAAGLALEDDDMLEIAFSEDRSDRRADAAASVLGPSAVGRLVDRVVELEQQVREARGRDKKVSECYWAIRDRIRFVRTEHLLIAFAERSDGANSRQLAQFAGFICGQGDSSDRDGQAFEASVQAKVASFVNEWGTRLLETSEATREQLASVAALAAHAPTPDLLPVLERLLDEELRRLRAFKEEARAVGYRPHPATNEARWRWTNQYQRAFLAIRDDATMELMQKYLLDEEFGVPAAWVLREQWQAHHEPKGSRHWGSGPDFSRVAHKRNARRLHPGATSIEADLIFSAVERLIGTDGADEKRKHAVALGTVAAALPHGERHDILGALVDAAEVVPRRALLTNLVLSGKTIDTALVRTGIADLLAAAETQPWIISDYGELRAWLSLLPFTNRPSETIEIIGELPGKYRRTDELEDMLDALAQAPGAEAELVLFRLAEITPQLYGRKAWRDAVSNRGTESSATRFISLVAAGALSCGTKEDPRDLAKRVGHMMEQHAKVRDDIYGLLEDHGAKAEFAVLAHAVAESPDAEGFILLVRLEMQHGHSLMSWRTVENVVTNSIASEVWDGAYEVLPTPAPELRKQLLDMTDDGGPSDVPARYLREIDRVREHVGAPESEPRHPDIVSGKCWPIIGPSAEPKSDVGSAIAR